jgi:peptide/nickel transport system substrate-binding protein
MTKTGMTRRDILAAGGKSIVLAGLAGTFADGRSAFAQSEERVLHFAVNDFGNNNLDPSTTKGINLVFEMAMYDGAFPLNVDTGKVEPGVIEKWELSPDGTVWTFSLRKGVVFHDGSPFSAPDFVFSVERIMREDAFQFDVNRKYWGYPLKSEIIDDHTVKITTPAPTPRLVVTYSDLTPPHLFMLPKAYIEKNGYDYFAKNPIGTGSYKFVRFVENDSLEYEAVDYPHWSGVVPDFKRVIVTMVPEDATRMFQLEKGEIDGTVSSLDSAVSAKAKGFDVLTGSLGLSQLNFIGQYMPEAKSSPLSDVRIRKALSLAINRQEIVDTLLGGLGALPSTQQALNIRGDDVAPWLGEKWGPKMADLWRYDPDEAKKLIAEAGYGSGFSADIWTAPDTSAPFLGDIIVAMASYWAQVGFQANIISVDSAAWVANRRPPKSMQLVGKAGGSATSLSKPVAIDRFQYWTSDGGVLNLFIGSPDQAKLDQIYTDGQKAVDVEAYTKLIDEGLELTTPTYTCVSIVEASVPVLIGPRAKSVIPPGSTYPSAYFAKWKYTGKEI